MQTTKRKIAKFLMDFRPSYIILKTQRANSVDADQAALNIDPRCWQI